MEHNDGDRTNSKIEHLCNSNIESIARQLYSIQFALEELHCKKYIL